MPSDKELELAGEVALPEVAGFVFKVSGRWKQRWEARTTEIVSAVCEHQEITPEELDARLAAEPVLDNMVAKTIRRACEESDEVYRRALAHMIASVLDDTAMIDANALLADEILELNPIHLRALRTTMTEGPHNLDGARPINAWMLHRTLPTLHGKMLTPAILSRLVAAGFVQHQVISDPDKQAELAKDGAIGGSVWTVTRWGRLALDLCFPRTV